MNHKHTPMREAPVRPKETKKAPVTKDPARSAVRKKHFSFFPSKKTDFVSEGDLIRVKGSIDYPLMIIILILVLFGCVMVFSSSYALGLHDYGDSFYYIKPHIRWVLIGLAAMFTAAFLPFDYTIYKKLAPYIYLFSLALLCWVLIYGYAAHVAKRWMSFFGIGLQPSEIMKFALVLMLAAYAAAYYDEITDYAHIRKATIKGNLIPFLILLVPLVLVAAENHLSGTIIIAAIGLVVIFCSGALVRWFFAIAPLGAAGLFLAYTFVPYVHKRVDIFLHPENYNVQKETWQTTQGLIAVGSGGWFGVGLGNSRQKHMFVSMPYNDFIFSIICEELGFIGALFVILLFVLLIWRGLVIARRAPEPFARLTAIGLTTHIGLQAILNMMVVTDIIPNTGISLPFISYGGTALMMQMGEMGILLAISKYSRQTQ